MKLLRGTISINVDIDAIRFYHGIHGLAGWVSSASDPIWALGIPRFLELFAELNLSATFFVVASDLVSVSDGGAARNATEAERRRELVRNAIARGHEVASHSFGHDYALSHRPFHEIYADLQRARDILTEVTGVSIEGFRAPGYNLSRPLIDAIQESKAIYSSSRLPSPPYFAAKWMILLKGALMRRPSRSIVGEIAAPFFSRKPYRHQGGLLELPISVFPLSRLPAIGTFLTLYGERGCRWLLPYLKQEQWLNLEFHGIDLTDSSDVGIGQDLIRCQPDLSTPLIQKRTLFKTWFSSLLEGRNNLTLVKVANQIAKSL